MSKENLPAQTIESSEAQTVSRRNFLKGSAVVGGLSMLETPLIAAALDQVRPGADGKKPNIVFIISDQINIDTIAAFAPHYKDPAYGSHWVRTPNLDRLAKEGVSFMESHSANPVCCPSRSCMFTGRMATETGVITNNIGIDENVPNMGQWFEQHSNYRRVYCGKWHIGGAWSYPEVSGPRKIPGFDIMPVGGSGSGIYIDPQVSNSVSSFILNDTESTPYLIVASFMNPHDCCYWFMNQGGLSVTDERDDFHLNEQWPILPPNFQYDFKVPHGLEPYRLFPNDTAWRNFTYDYYRQVEDVDENVGRVMDAVRQRNDDTVVIFIGDHGEGLGRHHLVSKWHPFESSVKVPFIIWNPKRIKADVLDTEHLINNVDIMPTLCSYAGIEPPPNFRGLNLRPIVDKDVRAPVQWRDNVYSEFQLTGRMIRTRKYKYVMKYRSGGNFEAPFVKKSDGSHTAFVPGQGEDYEEDPNQLLFDMENDPWELKNLVDDPTCAKVVEEHRAILRHWEATLVPGHHFDRN